MKIGVPKEIKADEFRVGMTPAAAKSIALAGHKVAIEKGAGLGSGFKDEEYIKAGCSIVDSPDEIYAGAEMIIKVKEPMGPEFNRLRKGQILFTYLHLAPALELTKVLLEKRIIGIAYETVQLPDGTLPLLAPMSEIAGRMAVSAGVSYLLKHNGGKGVLLSGVPGVERCKVTIVGGGIVGINAAKMAVGLGARVTVLEKSIARMRYLDDVFGSTLQTLYSNETNLEKAAIEADLVVGAVLIPGAAAPKLVKEYMVQQMAPGSVIVDVAIDQGGCVETVTHPTTHSNPVYEKHGVIHYCVANMPGAVSRSSTFALNNATIDYSLKLANLGGLKAIQTDRSLWLGVNTFDGALTCKPVAEALNMPYTPLEKILQS